MTLAARPEAFRDLARQPRRVAAHLAFASAGGRTFLARQLTPHPFHITRVFRFADDPAGAATLYLQSSAGGLYGDDDLSLSLSAKSGAFAHVTTQASTVVPPARGGAARHAVDVSVAEGATLEYLPDPLILFDGADARTSLDVSVAPGGRAIVADGLVLHRPGGGSVEAAFDNRVAIRWTDDGRSPLVEHQRAAGAALRQALSLPREPDRPLHYAAVYAVGAADCAAVATAVREALAGLAPAARPRLSGVSALAGKGVVVARLLAGSGAAVTAGIDAAWRAARAAMAGGPAPRRRRK